MAYFEQVKQSKRETVLIRALSNTATADFGAIPLALDRLKECSRTKESSLYLTCANKDPFVELAAGSD